MVADVALTLLGGGFAAALALGWILLAVPRGLRIYAHPNARSFHDEATPTSGGVAFVVPLAGYLWWVGAHGSAAALALAGGGSALAAVGLWDDVRDASALWRLLLQLVVCGVVAWFVLGAGSHWLLAAAVAVALAWHVNLYNFMDGIDGLAGAQALVFAVGAQLVGRGLPGFSGDLLWLMAGGVVGFLVFNWPRARMFMGDVGSYFLGLLTGAVAVLLWRQQTLPLPASLILLSGFWFDATYTLIVRALTGQAFTQAHRSHLYQKIAARRGHRWTTVCYLLYAAVWLLPLSWLCARSSLAHSPWTLFWLLPAVIPLAVAAWRHGAGLPPPTAER